MRIPAFIATFLLLYNIAFTQNGTPVASPSSFFKAPKTPVLVVGCFHFDYPGLDAHKAGEGDKIDVLKEPKKTEVTMLVNYIKKFKPTKIAIEAFPEWNATEKLRRYKTGELKDQRDERYQLGMRIAKEMNLDTLYSIDDASFDEDLTKLGSTFTTNLFKDYDFQSNDPYDSMYKRWITYDDKLPSRIKLLDYMKHMNSSESHKLGYGVYLVGDFKLDNRRGADIVSLWWYNRNMRIFRKLQQITEPGKDKILVIFGNGHAAILRQLLECSPEYKFVEFDSL